MTMSDTERFRTAQGNRLATLRESTKDKPAHAGFLAILEDAAPGEVFEDLPLPRGVSRAAADALIDDYRWTIAAPPEPGMSVNRYPDAYASLRLRQARAAAQRAQTRAANDTWAGFRFEKGN